MKSLVYYVLGSDSKYETVIAKELSRCVVRISVHLFCLVMISSLLGMKGQGLSHQGDDVGWWRLSAGQCSRDFEPVSTCSCSSQLFYDRW